MDTVAASDRIRSAIPFRGPNVWILACSIVIASAGSQSQMVAMADNVDEKLTKAGCSVKSIEGAGSDTWILMDYGFCLVHIFSDEARSFYNLERMWKDAADVTETFRPTPKA